MLLTITDAQGRVTARAEGPAPTLYSRIGDVFAWACAAGARFP
ncbi:hypothetical protein PY650_03550 [Rhizobium calliandrae]|uniref:Uncharacterized protein n=1 Tax=Rhizobium calliandrae TaxID=1312182 RepID=A0ABT7K805_9HYPH|nr:hypothetical protein [Rhizobium calliandrae]MDL2404746.1 hypothetical protein [Rhizobium calliandrae]